MRLTKISLFVALLLALVIMAGCRGQNDNAADTAEIEDGLQGTAFNTEVVVDSEDVEVLGEQDFSYGSIPIPMIPHEGGAVLGNFMKLIEK
jgi:hypothetical protein